MALVNNEQVGTQQSAVGSHSVNDQGYSIAALAAKRVKGF